MAHDHNTSSASRLFIISNRLPVTLKSDLQGDFSSELSSGGLVTALSHTHAKYDSLWIGWPGEHFADAAVQKRIEILLRSESRCIPVFLSADDIQGYYHGFSNGALWPLLHYFESRLAYDEEEWESYVQVNRLFCDVILQEAHGDELIWVHDYHLFLLPGMLRQHLPEARIGFFLHTPFPSSEMFRILPRREDLLQGVLGADVIGFHTFNYMQNFVWSVYRVLGIDAEKGYLSYGGRHVTFGVHPIGIDPNRFLHAIHADPATITEMDRLNTSIGERKLILGMDRLDYSKGIPARLRAYRRFLEAHPAWHGRVSLLQVAIPSRESVGAYQELKRQVDELVGEINGTYGTTTWAPIQYIYRNLPFYQICALLRRADVAWVTPMRDGMNLVAKEYVACQEQRPGALMIGEFVGASAEMGEAFIVNPYDEEGMAAKLYEILSEDTEVLRGSMAILHQRVCANTVEVWAEKFCGALEQVQFTRRPPAMLPGERQQLLSACAEAQRRVFLLDYDGTLSPLMPPPHSAAPSHQVLSLLQKLQQDPRNVVTVISARDRAASQQWFGACHCCLVAEDGAWRYTPVDGTWHKLLQELNDDWKATVRPILEQVVEQTPGSSLEEKTYSLVWHYRLADPEFALWQARELCRTVQGMPAGAELQVQSGHKLVEVKWAKIHKGVAASHIIEQAQPVDFVLAMGDDSTDECLFEAVPPQQWTMKVGMGVSSARFSLSSPADVIQLLRALAGDV